MKSAVVAVFTLLVVLAGSKSQAITKGELSKEIHKLAYTTHSNPNGTSPYDVFDTNKILGNFNRFEENTLSILNQLGDFVQLEADQTVLIQMLLAYENESTGNISSNPVAYNIERKLAKSQLTEDAQLLLVSRGIHFWSQSEMAVLILENQKVVYSKVKELAWSQLKRPAGVESSTKFAESPLAVRLARTLASKNNDSATEVEKLAAQSHPVLPEEADVLRDSVNSIVDAVKRNPTDENKKLLLKFERIIHQLHENLHEAAQSAAKEAHRSVK